MVMDSSTLGSFGFAISVEFKVHGKPDLAWFLPYPPQGYGNTLE